MNHNDDDIDDMDIDDEVVHFVDEVVFISDNTTHQSAFDRVAYV